MVIISRNRSQKYTRYGNTQFRYAMVYVLVTLAVLLALNLYSSKTSQKLIYESKKTSMLEKCQLAANEIAELEVLNPSTAASAVSQLGSNTVTRLIITDQAGLCVYDSAAADNGLGRYVLFPEIVQALDGNDVFYWFYKNGLMKSQSAMPVYSYGTLIGCVYMTEYDYERGLLINSLENNVLMITLILEAAVLVFSLIYSNTFSRRLQKIMTSMRIIQEGDFSHKVQMGGHDELTYLGDRFNDLTARLQDSERKRHQFVSDASHELKTPLASIKLLSDSILQNDMDTETIREFVGDIGNEAERLNRMSQKLLSLARLENQDSPEMDIVEIAPIIHRVVRMLGKIAAGNSITIHMDVEDNCPILIQEDDLYQIIFNLIENGIKYNIPGGTLTVRLSQQEDNAILRVSDSGVGIPENAIEHIFERFYRVDKARSRQSGGSGLGLAIVRGLVERYNGTIGVESTLGQGTAFTVTFPIFDTEEEA